MARRSKREPTYLEIAEHKADKLDWRTFNFLENLLVFCPMKQMNVPPESGVQFGISREAANDIVCLLFKIDRSPDPLITEASKPRPDYLVLYKTRGVCLFTIIEMKGRTENGLERGIEQMLYLRDRLKTEFAAHCALGLQAKFQGILLCPPNAQIPRKQIDAEADKGFVVSPLSYQHKAELFPYISTVHASPQRYAHQVLPRNDELNFVENLIIHRALPHREQDERLCARTASNSSSGVYINYALSNAQEYATLILDDVHNTILVKAETDEYLEHIKAVLDGIGLLRKFQCRRLQAEKFP